MPTLTDAMGCISKTALFILGCSIYSITGRKALTRGTFCETDHLLKILKFWHRLEFFTPFDLTSRTEQSPDKKKVFWFDRDTIEAKLAELTAFRPKDGQRIASAHLFVGVFSVSELERFAQEIFPDATRTLEDEERGLSEGRSCFARFGLDVDAGFRINFTDVEISTLPWALGQCRKSGLGVLKDSTYSESLPRLQSEFRLISDRAADHDEGALIAANVLDILRALESWSDFELPLNGLPIACVEVNLIEDKRRKPGAAQQAEPVKGDDAGKEQEEEVAESEIGILNSFYITDIERAMSCLEKGEEMGALCAFLSGAMSGAPVDLYGPEGRQAILDGVAPQLCNRGRWMSPPAHAMSLMQQFAINKAIALRGASGIFSVNGPPGTGKTTLLRDVIADNLVARAEALSVLKNASDAFEPKTKGESNGLAILQPALRGFGMVVASSNNAAVENISRDLPKASSIDAAADFGYLRPIAHKLAAQKPDGSFANLSPDDRPWGLVAAALGKKSNRYTFRQRVFFPSEPPAGNRSQAKSDEGVKPMNIWDWRKDYSGPSFHEAAAEFRRLSVLVTAETKLAQRFATLTVQLCGHTADSYSAASRLHLQETSTRRDMAADALKLAREAVANLEEKYKELREDERLLDRQRPAWWARLLGTKEARQHHRDVADNALKQKQARAEREYAIDHAEKHCADLWAKAEKAFEKASDDLAKARREFEAHSKEIASLRAEGFTLPETELSDLNQEKVQIAGLWHNDRIAAARSALTRAALQLHEAWLAEVSQKGGGFGSNLIAISNFLGGTYEGDLAPVWESLFMVVPLVSTTFASFARQFAGMPSGSLGWLFIDEAGQAVPQAAVGALMRARSVVVIGDPMQIEPVFTLPSALINALAGQAEATADGSRSPNKISLQGLSDQTNRFGARVTMEEDSAIWIGSPLRVHRRCCDPMFSLANEIAYQGKMVFGATERLSAADVSPHLGESAWIDIGGRVVGKQSVPAQLHLVRELVQLACLKQGRLPDLYVISPFKEIALGLREQLLRADWSKTRVKKSELQDWVKQHVGTVHTFQGKEEQVVLMVLGADADRAAAARWASSKPNLLNVALTRAKKRFYVIGDKGLWGQMAGFDHVARELPVLTPDEALCRARSVADQDAVF